ncbi:MAG: ABC transporter ATP-binding protein [Planctomycetota bacterium]|jgi:putative ABC transport system ATP-binding protein
MITVDGLTKTYAATGRTHVDALKDVSVAVEKGEFLALTGPSGSGKTTLLFSIAGMITPTQGSVQVDGVDVSALGGPARAAFRAEKMGFVFQMFYLVPYLTALENVCVGALAQGWSGAAARAAAEEVLGRVGLAERTRHLPGELSGGEQQRVSLARALVNGPAVLLADEPTGNLDAARAEEIMDLLERENRERGQTIVMATHNMKVAERASRRLNLENGHLIQRPETTDRHR